MRGKWKRALGLFYRRTMLRLAATYLVTFCIPLTVLLGFYYNQVSRSLREEYRSQLGIESLQMEGLYRDRFAALQSIESILGQNVRFCSYLSGEVSRDSDRVYDYLVYIKPQIDYIKMSQPLVRDVAIYSVQTRFNVAPNYFLKQWPARELPLEEVLSVRDPEKSVWRVEEEDGCITGFTCYLRIYSRNYSTPLGIVCLKVDPSSLLGGMEDAASSTRVAFLRGDRTYILRDGRLVQPDDAAWAPPDDGGRHLERRLPVRELGIEVLLRKEYSLLAGGNLWLWVVPSLFFLMLFTSVIFVYLSSGIGRTLRFSRYLQQVDYNQLGHYPEKGYGDEMDQLIASYNTLTDNINRLINNVYRMTIKSREAQFYALQSQINPHFLFNTLENIRMMAQIHHDRETAKMVLMLGKLFRYNLDMKASYSTVDDELLHACNYLELCRMRVGAKLRYAIRGGDEAFARVICPRNILQPLVENAIQHGFCDKTEDCRICIELEEAGEDLWIRVCDNGSGIEEERLRWLRQILSGRRDPQTDGEPHGVGLYNVSERLRLFYGEEYRLAVSRREEGGTRCEMRLRRATSQGDLKPYGDGADGARH